MPGATDRRPDAIDCGRHFVDQDDIDAVVAVLRGERLTGGDAVTRFERGLTRATGAEHAVAVASGSVALQLAYRALDVGAGTRVATSANTFVSTATAAIHCGAEVGFVDVEPRTGNLNADDLEALFTSGEGADVVTAVHFAGLPCEMDRLIELKRAYGFRLVEDAAHALGARYSVDGRWWRVGEHPEVDATVLSFHPAKLVTTGEGGAVLTASGELAARLRRLRDHGLERDRPAPSPGPAPMIELGWNARMSDVHAALGTSQLQKIPDFLAARREVAMRYVAELRDFDLPDPGGTSREHAWQLFVVRTGEDERDALFRALRARGIRARLHYHPVPLQPWFRERFGEPSVPNAERHARRALSLPIFPALTEAEQGRVIETLLAWRRGRVAA